MTGKVEIIVGLVDKADRGVAGVNATTSLIDQYNTDKSGFALVNENAQTHGSANLEPVLQSHPRCALSGALDCT
ncbi:hypothetical protein [Pseudomonas sp. 2835]|uniref:hypothetical protein n=1 Tax=Pseudomonas sp. 2835 TaxID=3156451 RepID=UPI003D1EC76C